jgi:hypothetical protein
MSAPLNTELRQKYNVSSEGSKCREKRGGGSVRACCCCNCCCTAAASRFLFWFMLIGHDVGAAIMLCVYSKCGRQQSKQHAPPPPGCLRAAAQRVLLRMRTHVCPRSHTHAQHCIHNTTSPPHTNAQVKAVPIRKDDEVQVVRGTFKVSAQGGFGGGADGDGRRAATDLGFLVLSAGCCNVCQEAEARKQQTRRRLDAVPAGAANCSERER